MGLKSSLGSDQIFDEAFRSVDLTSGQYSLLVTANIKPLRKRGRLETTVDPTEARSRLLALTPKGKTFLEQALPLWQSAQDRLLKSLSTSNEDRLLTALREVAN